MSVESESIRTNAEGTFRAHQVPLSNVLENSAHLQLLEEWMRSYRPEELFDDKAGSGRSTPRWRLQGKGEWARTHTPMEACFLFPWICLISLTMLWR
jgi:phosphoketolase